MILEHIHTAEAIEKLSYQEKQLLAKEIRSFMVEKVAKTGGHLSSNLGIVELTIALYSVYGSPDNKIVWDVGHQAYVHKILTGRSDRFDSLRQKDGLSGFPRTYESEYDLFNSGHASNSISLAYGLAKARDLKKQSGEVIAVIGDGALTGGMAYEALNNAGKGESKIIVLLNDNEMSIGHNVGYLSQNLSKVRTKKTYQQTKIDVKNMLLRMPAGGAKLYRSFSNVKKRVKYFLLNGVFFEEMGFAYLGPVDGHDINALEKVLKQARSLEESVIIHVRTVKGKGYEPAERDPSLFHGIGPFEPKTGEGLAEHGLTWSKAFGQEMVRLAEKDPDLCAVSAAMVDGTGLKDFETYYPERLFDVGIAEPHAVTFAAGLAKGGMKPVCAIYSTFLQRAYDSVLHDVCMNDLPVVLAVDRAGVVGEDGESHQGVYDLAYLCHIPGLSVAAPCDLYTLKAMLSMAINGRHPQAIRYPRGLIPQETICPEPVVHGKGVIVKKPGEKDDHIAVLALGCCVEMAVKAFHSLEAQDIHITVADARFAEPIDRDLVLELAKNNHHLITVEDHIEDSGFGSRVTTIVSDSGLPCRITRLAVPTGYVRQGKRCELLDSFGISERGVMEAVRKAMKDHE